MPEVKCKICRLKFYAKPAHIKKGFGKYCSNQCHYKDARKGRTVNCDICKKEVYRTQKELDRPKSKKYFCGKSCQTKWRNKEFSGGKHKAWKGGFSTYRNILAQENVAPFCTYCKIYDIRVLAVHHIDKNHKNNNLENLQWLCHNCHYLIHHGNLEQQIK